MGLRLALLDRDGTINVKAPEGAYITEPSEVQLLPGAAAAIARLNAAGVRVAVVTNQRCISLGLLSEEGLAAVNAEVARQLASEGASVDDWFHCPHGHDDPCGCRKPQPGMLLAAMRAASVEATDAVMIGDAESDMIAADRAAVRGLRVHHEPGKWPAHDSLAEAVGSLLRESEAADVPALSLLDLLVEDLVAARRRGEPDYVAGPSVTARARVIASGALRMQGLAVILFRLSHVLDRRSKLAGAFARYLNHALTGADFNPRARIGVGLYVPHPSGVVVGEGVRMGNACTLQQGCTLGGGPGGFPQTGNLVNVGPGARLLGPVRLGSNVHVGANAVVTKSFPDSNVVLLGVPARAHPMERGRSTR